jgi:hypothetical protein
MAQPVEPRGRAGEQIGLFRRRGAAREPLEGVEQQDTAGTLVDREVAFEHAAVGAEIIDAGFNQALAISLDDDGNGAK